MALAATLMYTLATAAFVVRWYGILDAYGPHGSDPEYLCTSPPGVSSWRMLFSEAMLGFNVVIADVIMVSLLMVDPITISLDRSGGVGLFVGGAGK